ncbi:MAG: hypothetical protein WBD73_15625 [Candidatus Acidiferrales bacterium]
MQKSEEEERTGRGQNDAEEGAKEDNWQIRSRTDGFIATVGM